MKSKTAWAQTYYRHPWQKHIAAKTRSVKSINLLNFMFNIVSFTFSPAWHKVHDTPLEESSRLSLDPRLDAALNVIHASIVIVAQRSLFLPKAVRVRQRKVRAMADVKENSA